MGNTHKIIKDDNIILSKSEIDYFHQIKKILRKNYKNFDDNDTNLETSLQKKSFEQTNRKETIIYNYYWKDFLYEWLEKQKLKNNFWAKLILILDEEYFLNENKFQSIFFYEDFAIQTIPKIIEQNNNNFNYNNNNFNFNNNNEISNKNEIELDVTENLGGSFLEMNNTEDLLPDDPQLKYQKGRILVKKYIKIFKKHLFEYNNHPIVVIVRNFNKIFCDFTRNKLNEIRNDFQSQKIKFEEFNKKVIELEKKLTKTLQKFIIKMENTLKLFYTNCINFSVFEHEKDELTNLITNLVFKTGKLYETIYELYNESLNKTIKDLQDKLEYLKDIKPEDLDIKKQFCLDEVTLKFQKEILEEKRKEKNKLKSIIENENEENENENEDNNNNNDDDDGDDLNKTDIINTNVNNKNNNNYINNNNINNNNINNNKNNNINNNINNNNNNINNNNNNINNNNNTNIIIDNTNSINSSILSQDDNYITGPKKNPSNSNFDIPPDSSFPLRYTVNINNPRYLFPNLHKQLRDTIGITTDNITETIKNKKIPTPYQPGINLLRSIKKYKTPFEKMMIIASISDTITECASTFWKEMKNYIKKDLLCIEADELMTIFLFIIVKSKMPELAIFAKMIKHFTTSTTRGTMIGYYYTTLEATIAYIEELKDINEVIKKKEFGGGFRESIRNSIRNSKL